MRDNSLIFALLYKVLFVVSLFSVTNSYANSNDAGQYLIVAHPSVAEQVLTTRQLAKIYVLQTKNWTDGNKIKAFSYEIDSRDFKAFCASVLHLQPYQIQRVWNRMLFTGVGNPPFKVSDSHEMLTKIKTTKGAIGYVLADAKHDLTGLKVIEVER